MEVEVKGKKVIITFDVDADQGRSASGKSIIAASTYGAQPIEGTALMLNLNAYRPARQGGRRAA